MASVWDNETIEKEVIDLWNERGWSALVIANHVNGKWPDKVPRQGLTRNSVVAKVHRLRASGVKMRGRPLVRGSRVVKVKKARVRSSARVHRPDGQTAPTRLALAIQATPFKAKHDDTKPTVMSVADLEPNHCRWPIGDVGQPGFGFCGAERFLGFPYCSKHAATGYAPPSMSRRADPVPLLTTHEKKERQLV